MPTKPFSPAGVNLDLGTPVTVPTGNMTVRMKRVAYYNSARLAVGSSYSVSIEWGKWAVEQGYAEDPSGILPYQDSPAGLSAAEVASVQALVSGGGAAIAASQGWPRFAVMGDSIGNQHAAVSSSTNYLNAKGVVTRLLQRMGWPAKFTTADSYSADGANSSEMLTTGGQVDRVIAQHATTPYRRVFISIGTNDQPNGLTYDQSIANLAEIFSRFIAAGIIPAFWGILPRGNDAAITTAKRTQMRINSWAFQYSLLNPAVEVFDGGKYVADNAATYGGSSDSAGNIIAAAAYDSILHPSDWGAELIAEAGYEYYTSKGGLGSSRARVGMLQGDKFHSTENPWGVCFKSPNPLMTGTTGALAGGATGVAPTGMTVSAGAWSKGTQTLPNGTTIPSTVCALAASATHFLYDDCIATGSLSNEGINAGDKLEAVAVVKLTGTTGITTIKLAVGEYDGSTSVTYDCGNAGTPAKVSDVSGSKTLTLVVSDVVVRPYFGSGNANFDCKLTCTTVTGGGTFEVLQFQVRKIPAV